MDEPSASSILLKLATVILLVLANGFFVAAEFAIVSVRRSRIEALVAQGNRRARTVLHALEDVRAFISAVQFGITVASLVLGWLGEETFARVFQPPLERIIPGSFAPTVAAHSIATALALAVVTYLHLLLGEFVPKAIALDRAERVSLVVAGPMAIFYRIFKAPIWFINQSGVVTLRMLGMKATAEHASVYSEDELRQLIMLSHQSGHLIADEQQLISNVFDFTEATVESVMMPRTEIEALEADLSPAEMLEIFEEMGYSRMPVYRDSLDNIIGIMLQKDLSRLVRQGQASSIDKILRPAVFLPTSMRLNDALRSLRRSSAHMALVVDEHGGVEGLVTLEDLIEEIVGDIRDEHDEIAVRQIVEHPDGSFTVTGGLSIRDANKRLDLGLPEADSYHTIAGFMMARAGRLLATGESVDFNGLRLTVQGTARNRIIEARIERLQEPREIAPTISGAGWPRTPLS
jgi:CBS domain containing-hemolysin-like protein